MEIEEFINIAESDSWTVTEEEYSNGKGLLFSKYSPAGQDFSISTGPFESAEELINSIHQRYVEYDVDSEAYLWLDSEGHGKNGAPYRMREGRKGIINDIPRMDILETARQSAAHTLVPMLVNLGFKAENIKISFRKKFTSSDLSSLIDGTSVENK